MPIVGRDGGKGVKLGWWRHGKCGERCADPRPADRRKNLRISRPRRQPPPLLFSLLPPSREIIINGGGSSSSGRKESFLGRYERESPSRHHRRRLPAKPPYRFLTYFSHICGYFPSLYYTQRSGPGCIIIYVLYISSTRVYRVCVL